MEMSAGEEDSIAENGGASTSTLAKRKRPATDGASSSGSGAGAAAGGGGIIICDDTVGNILARLPARTAIACTALSKQHRSLIRSPEFRSLHCRLGAPLPRPHIAYLAPATISRRGRPEKEDPASGYYGFHLAGAGLTGAGNGDSPIRSVAGRRYHGTKYVNTCNGILLLAPKGFSDACQCTLWNPAVADPAREATISISKPRSSSSSEEEISSSESIFLPGGEELWNKKTQFLALGLGYSRRSNTYKLLLCRRDRYWIRMLLRDDQGKVICHMTGGPTERFEYSLVVHSLGGDTTDDMETLLRAVLTMDPVLAYRHQEVKEDIIKSKSLYMDGTIYVLYSKKDVILRAFNVDDEMVHTIGMPRVPKKAKYQLTVMNGQHRPCLVVIEEHCIELWKLTRDYQWEAIHVISYEISSMYLCSIAGAWDCGSVLLLLLNRRSATNMLLMYDVTSKKIFRAKMPCDLVVQNSDYILCWGYSPTLVSPESIVGEFNQDMERRRGRSVHITEAINPLLLQDRRKGQKATLNIVCLMEFLVRILQKLPHDLQDVVDMLKIDSEEPGSLFHCVVSFD